jgi:hypothetical protein
MVLEGENARLCCMEGKVRRGKRIIGTCGQVPHVVILL